MLGSAQPTPVARPIASLLQQFGDLMSNNACHESRISVAGLCVDPELFALVNEEIAPGTNVTGDEFWRQLANLVRDLGDTNRKLLDRRDELQSQLDQWHREHRGRVTDLQAYQQYLRDIGYLVDEPLQVAIRPTSVDSEIASIAGPQLVVPVDNARYALNAANARWGSLYDALYGTDAIAESAGLEKTSQFNEARAAKVFERSEALLDEVAPLDGMSYSAALSFAVDQSNRLVALTADGGQRHLVDPNQFAGYTGPADRPTALLLSRNGLHIELQIDPTHAIGKLHRAGLKDVLLESAVTTIADCEDAVSAVDAEDKIGVYRNWLGLMKGTLAATFTKNGQEVVRKLNEDRNYTASSGGALRLPGRSLLLVRNCGMHMYTDAVTDAFGNEIPEGFLDAMVTCLCAKHDLLGNSERMNSRAGSIYVVKPKMHGPEEVAASVELFERVEKALGLELNTIKMGIMDEERRTTVNLKACIDVAKERLIFINTGFLDRTGDEIHTDMEAGPMVRKTQMKAQPWITAYEDWNVDIGLECGLSGKAQIGKGMWAMPDAMAQMLVQKIDHPRSGATTAWVPSPTAATLHATHYLRVNVFERHTEIGRRTRAALRDILTVPVQAGENLSETDIDRELENNVQGILGYVVRWVEQGIGCSKVPDINDIGLMEDRATLRISSQHIANWLHHGVVNEARVKRAFEKLAPIVDRQNSSDPDYVAMAPTLGSSIAFQAALDLVFTGRAEPNGYTEPVLHRRRREAKARLAS